MLRAAVWRAWGVFCFAGWLIACRPSAAAQEELYPYSALREVPFERVTINDPFWSERIRIIQEITLPDLLNLAEQQGKIDNFRIVAGRKAGRYRFYNAADSDVYKLIEDAAYSLAWRRNAALEKRLDALADDIVSAQQPDGYLDTQFTLVSNTAPFSAADAKFVEHFGFGAADRWKSTVNNWPLAYSQLYCAGHLMEAAVAYFRATGKRVLLDAAIRNADHIASVFTVEKIKSYADHPEVEIGLMKLYEATRKPRYAELAGQFCRYVHFSRPPDLGGAENSKPLAEQREAFGHCVRTAYIYSGATDVARAAGASDLRAALFALWDDVIGRKMYVHGGTGNGSAAEQHGFDFDLPIGATYSETCAAIAQAQWNHRLNLLTGDARFADVVELESWNAALSGISLDGTNYFYCNKLNEDTAGRRDAHSGVRQRFLFCCPSKVPGFVAGVGRWIYAQDERGVTVNQFIGSEMETEVAGQLLKLKLESELPWTGRATLKIEQCPAREFEIRLRLPAWARGGGPIPGGLYHYGNGETPKCEVAVNGRLETMTAGTNGYQVIRRLWRAGDRIEFSSTTPVRRIYTDDRVAANRGRVALMRGPLLYALEGVDNSFSGLEMELPKEAMIRPEFKPELLGGVTVLRGQGVMPDGRKVDFIAIPYFAWENRGISTLATLLIEDRGRIENEKAPIRQKPNTDG